MLFPVKTNKFSGLLRKFRDRGYPKIELISSRVSSDYPPESVLQFEDEDSHWASENSLDSQFVVKLVNGVLRISHYSIRSHFSDNNYMQKWTLEGSNDNKNYVMIDNRPQNSDLKSSGIGQYSINDQRIIYQYFRIKQTMNTPLGNNVMRISGLDFYGEYLPFQPRSCKSSIRRYNFLLVMNIMISR